MILSKAQRTGSIEMKQGNSGSVRFMKFRFKIILWIMGNDKLNAMEADVYLDA